MFLCFASCLQFKLIFSFSYLRFHYSMMVISLSDIFILLDFSTFHGRSRGLVWQNRNIRRWKLAVHWKSKRGKTIEVLCFIDNITKRLPFYGCWKTWIYVSNSIITSRITWGTYSTFGWIPCIWITCNPNALCWSRCFVGMIM